MNTRFSSLTAVMVLLFVPAMCFAGQNDSPDASGNAPKPASPAEAEWWTKSSLETPTIPPQFLYHIEGTLSYMDAQGNTNGSLFNGQTGFDIRKWRFTDRVVASLSKQDIAYFGQGKVNFSEDTLRNELEFGITRRSLLVGGIEDYRNTLMFMDERLTEYFGGGITLSGEASKQTLELIAGVGYSEFTFDSGGIERINPNALAQLPTLTPSSGGGYGMEIWHWKALPQLALMQDTSYMNYFNQVLGHKWMFDVEANMPIAKIFSTVVGYHLKDENNVFINTLGVRPRDQQVTVGLRVSR